MMPKDQLFATLDVTAHGGVLLDSMRCIFMDTVGFIADIPFKLVDAFNATLEDALVAVRILYKGHTKVKTCFSFPCLSESASLPLFIVIYQ